LQEKTKAKKRCNKQNKQMTLTATPLNHVIQDQGFESKYGRAPVVNSDSEIDRIQAHLEFVCQMLEKNNLNNNTASRENMIKLLRQYLKEAQFPSNFQYTPCGMETRVPCFIDDSGVHCAAGYLMKHSGFEQLAQDLNSNFRFNYVHEMLLMKKQDDDNSVTTKGIFAELNRFLQESNLSAEEVATIQPTYDFARWNVPVQPPQIPSPFETPSTVVHTGVKCDHCGTNPINNVRYKCANCADFDLCETCESSGTHGHPADHVFLKIKKPITKQFDAPLVKVNLYQ